jgi:hypothetical protein
VRKEYVGYYYLSDNEIEAMWASCRFVFDANVLLNLYRYQPAARDDLLKVLGKLQERVWIPYQVGLEYQRNRLAVISGEKLAFSNARKMVQDLATKVVNLFDDRARNPHPNQAISAALETLKATVATIDGSLKEMGEAQSDVHQVDPVREALSSIFSGRVGDPPDEGWLKKSEDEAGKRLAVDIPPGGRDADKAYTYTDRGLVYPAKNGDYYVWKQLIEYFSTHDHPDVIFVTDDRKNDWWAEVNGKTVGPRPELIEEVQRSGKVKRFQMYTSDRFLQHAKKFVDPEVRDESITQVREANTALESESSQVVSPTYLAVRHYLREMYPGARIISFGRASFMIRSSEQTSKYIRVFAPQPEEAGDLKLALLREYERLRTNMASRAAGSGTLIVVVDDELRMQNAVLEAWTSNPAMSPLIDLAVGVVEYDSDQRRNTFLPMVQLTPPVARASSE